MRIPSLPTDLPDDELFYWFKDRFGIGFANDVMVWVFQFALENQENRRPDDYIVACINVQSEGWWKDKEKSESDLFDKRLTEMQSSESITERLIDIEASFNSMREQFYHLVNENMSNKFEIAELARKIKEGIPL